MSTEVIDAVNNLTEQTTELLGEFQDAKVNIDKKVELATTAQQNATTKAGEAATSAGAAAVSATEANTAKAGAKSEADRAELAASQATQVSGLETVEQAVTQALADGGYTWRTEADMQHERAVNDEMFAASGFVHMGKHYNGSSSNKAINEGLWTTESQVDTSGLALRLGRSPADTIFSGNSKSNLSVINIAGFVTEITDLNENNARCGFKFPESEAGTRVYDSATGVSIDYAKEIDPKYGDIAPDHNEAVARAFEGDIKNGDFRFGDNGLIIAETYASYNIADGALQISNTQATGGYVKVAGLVYSAVTYEAEFVINAPIDMTASVLISSSTSTGTAISTTSHNLVAGVNRIKIVDINFTASGSNGAIMFRPMSANETISVSNIELRPTTQEVVTDRVDMFGFEGWLEQVTTTNPFVYKHGLIQSQATTMDGIVTTSSNRPDSYYAVYDGDTTSRGKGVNFWALSVIEQDAIANNPKNHIYRMTNGDLVQWRIRQRTIAGAGNGDWNNLKPINGAGNPLSYSGSSVISPQGKLDSIVNTRNNGRYHDQQWGASIGNSLAKSNGIFLATLGNGPYNLPDTTKGYNGECYFYVIATVPRLNQGAYHPELNPMGTATLLNEDNNPTGGSYWKWYNSAAHTLTSLADCFDFGVAGSGHKVFHGGSLASGSTFSGSPDGKYFDAIYASGLGGVIDHRLKYGAWDASSSEQAAAVREEVKNGTYRGREKLVFTKVYDVEISGGVTSGTYSGWSFQPDAMVSFIGRNREVGEGYFVVNKDTNEIAQLPLKMVFATDTRTQLYYPTSWGVSPSIYFIFGALKNITVEGEFTQTDVIGNPANILQVDALKDGWLGSWISVIPDGTSKKFSLTRKVAGSVSINRVYTVNNGADWISGKENVNSVINEFGSSYAAAAVSIVNYRAFAKQTEPSSNLPVFNGENGLSDVFVSQSFNTLYGSLLFESALGQINKHSGYATGSYKLIRCGFEVLSGKPYLKSIWGYPTIPLHSDISLRNQENGGGAGKALFHQSSESEQANLNIIANELIYDSVAGDLGDDSTMKILNGTFTDDNGNTCKSVIHKLSKPYGWIKNEI